MTTVILSLKVKQKFSLSFPFLQNDFVVETSLVGTVFNGLSHLNAVKERGQFVVGLLRGLGGNLNLKTRQEFAREVSSPVFFCCFFLGRDRETVQL